MQSPEGSNEDVDLWTGCIAGGLLASELEALVREAGFVEVEIIRASMFRWCGAALQRRGVWDAWHGIKGRRPEAERIVEP